MFPLPHWESFTLAVSPVTVAPVAFGGPCTFLCDKGCSLLPASEIDTAFLLELWSPFQMDSQYHCVQSRSPSPTGTQAWSSGRKCFARLIDMIGMKVPQAGLERPVVLGEWLWGPCPSTCLSSCTLSLLFVLFCFSLCSLVFLDSPACKPKMLADEYLHAVPLGLPTFSPLVLISGDTITQFCFASRKLNGKAVSLYKSCFFSTILLFFSLGESAYFPYHVFYK